MAHQPIPADVKAALEGSILGYLHHETTARVERLKTARRFQTHGSMLNSEFIRCLVGSKELPAGTEVYAFEHKRLGYSAYTQIGDESYPARGATIFTTGSDWTLVALIDLEGHTVVADAYVATEPHPRKAIGTVN